MNNIAIKRDGTIIQRPDFSYMDRPCAADGLTSYRYQGRFGWIMIGAKNTEEALKEADRSISSRHAMRIATIDKLQVWNGRVYAPVTGK